MNGYGPSVENLTGIKKLIFLFLNWFLNFITKVIGFKITNANIHDESYKRGRTEADRIKADTGFLRKLLIDCEGIRWKIAIAYIFYFAVRLGGYHFFFYEEGGRYKYLLTK